MQIKHIAHMKSFVKDTLKFTTTAKLQNKILHKASPSFRKAITQYGLMPRIGESYSKHYAKTQYNGKLTPAVFAYTTNASIENPVAVGHYESLYDDDIWEINADSINWLVDDGHTGSNVNAIVTYSRIMPAMLTLVHKGTGEYL